MNQFLAEMYNTRETIGAPVQSDDTEKLAEAQLLDDALRAEGIDVDTLSPEAILKVAQSLFPDGALVKAAAEGSEKPEEHEEHETATEEKKEEAAKEKEGEGESMEEKMAQADFLGRQMAHAFMNEQSEITKAAGPVDVAKAGLGKLKKLPEALRQKATAMKGAVRRGKITDADLGAGILHSKKGFGGAVAGAKNLIKEHPKTVGGAAAGLAAAGAAGGYAAHKKKEGSALDKLAEQRALEILAENGIGQDGDEKLASAVEQRAWELLAENGYVSEE